MVDWSNLPEDLLNFIAIRLFSLIELKCFRSICKSWRSSVSGTGNDIPFPSRPLIDFNPIPAFEVEEFGFMVYHFGVFLSRVTFFRVTLPSESKGWLIKSNVDVNSGRFRLLHPLTHNRLCCSFESLDLGKRRVSLIRDAYVVYEDSDLFGRNEMGGLITSVVVKVKEGKELQYGVLGIGWEGNITYWNGNVLRILEKTVDFCDIIVHKGVTYAMDSQGIVWRVSSNLEISRYGSLLNKNNITANVCFGALRFVDCFGELYIVEQETSIIDSPKYTTKNIIFENTTTYRTTVFRVYKMDDDDAEVGKLVEVKSLGDNAFVMSAETCFSILAHEFYGCLKNSIYFVENNLIKVYKLDNGNIITHSPSESCFGMFGLRFY